MAVVCSSALPSLPLDSALKIHDFHRSGALYNRLPDDSDQPPVADEHIANLAAIFVRHNAHKVLGVHLIHGHFQVPEDTVLVGTTFSRLGLRWTKLVSTDALDPSTVHGHIFAVTENGMCSYELQRGPLPDLSGIGKEFLTEFTGYLIMNNLASIIGLQVLGYEDISMYELILEQGTVMVDSSLAKNLTPTCVTGWKFESVNGNPRVCQANETHAKMTSGNHKVFNAGKPLPKLDNIDDLKSALSDAGVL